MSHALKFVLLTTTATVAVMLPICAHAQDSQAANSQTADSQSAKKQTANSQAAKKPDQPQAAEEIVVTGIRGSLDRALNVKRNADSFVDAVNAEEVGKLPDANLAEVMQRVPGVAIQRTRGEGDFISIRGLGPNFVRGEIDGRTVVSATESSDWTRNGGVFASTGRATNFDVLPAEIVQNLEVMKSPTASTVEGGIGGVVNIHTQEPLKLGTHYFLSASGEYRSINGAVDPEVSGLASWVNGSGHFGILADVSYSKRTIREDGVDSYGWATPTNWAAWPNIDSTGAGVANLTGLSSAWTVHPRQDVDTRKRLTAQTKAQWEMPDGGLLTGNLLYSRRSSDMLDLYSVVDIAPTAFVNPPPGLVPPGLSGISTLGNCAVNPPAGGFCTVPGATAANGAITSLQVNSTTTNNLDQQSQRDTMAVMGLNYRKSFGRLSVDGDISYSRAKGSMLDTRASINLAYATPWQFWTTNNSLQIQPIGSPNLSSPSDYYTRGVSITSRQNDQSEKAAAFNSRLDFEATPLLSALEFGVRVAERDVNRQQYFDPNPHDANLPLPAGTSGIYPTGNFGDGAFAVPFSQFLFVPISTVESVLQAGDPANNASFGASQFDPLNSYKVKEDTYAFYLQADLKTELFNIPISGNVGVRGVDTKVSTTGYFQPFTIQFNQQNLGTLVYTSSTISSTDFKNQYFNLLPQLNLKADIRDNLLLRLSVGQTVTRPDFQTQLAPALTGINAQNKIASAGNPSLKAYTSTNYDFGAEWYLAKSSALYAAVFYKSINNFIGESTQFNVERFGYTWNSLNTPENQGNAEIKGLEVGYQQVWPIGIGYILNATFASSSAQYTSGVNEGKVLPFEGVSPKSFNAALFYEKHGFAARVAYSYRDKYVLLASDVFGLTEYNAPYGQLDGSISYEVFKNWTVVLDAVNLTRSANKIYTIQPGDPLSYTQVGARYLVGLRAKF